MSGRQGRCLRTALQANGSVDQSRTGTVHQLHLKFEAHHVDATREVKRWKQNIQAPVVQQVRDSLGTHEQGLIITTSNFSKGAREEAERRDAVPVALMNGEQLVTLLMEQEVGVAKTRLELFELPDS